MSQTTETQTASKKTTRIRKNTLEVGKYYKIKKNCTQTYLKVGDVVKVSSIASNTVSVVVILCKNYSDFPRRDIKKSIIDVTSKTDCLSNFTNNSNNILIGDALENFKNVISVVPKFSEVVLSPDQSKMKNYLIYLCSNYGLNLSDVSSIEQSFINSNKKEATDQFFAFYKANKKSLENKKIKITLDSDKIKSLSNFKINQNNDYIKTIQNSIKSDINLVINHQKDIEILLNRMAENREKIAHTLKPINMLSSLEKINALNFFTFDKEKSSIGENEQNPILVFSTKEVILSSRPNENPKVSYNFGSFYVRYSPNQNSIRVLKKHNNHPSNGYYHPHIDQSGTVCWGNANDTYVESMNLMKPELAFEKLKALLQTYGGTPYKSLGEFIQERDKMSLYEDFDKKMIATSTIAVREDKLGQSSKEGLNYLYMTKNPYGENTVTIQIYENLKYPDKYFHKVSNLSGFDNYYADVTPLYLNFINKTINK